MPALIINREGNFDTVFNANRNAIGTVWNAWQTQWSGTTTTTGGSLENIDLSILVNQEVVLFFKEQQPPQERDKLDKVSTQGLFLV